MERFTSSEGDTDEDPCPQGEVYLDVEDTA
jgi:hypothetical protein